jgi:hypothetical protein
VGDMFDLVLRFRQSGDKKVNVSVVGADRQ